VTDAEALTELVRIIEKRTELHRQLLAECERLADDLAMLGRDLGRIDDAMHRIRR
jgi:hypothetical protein